MRPNRFLFLGLVSFTTAALAPKLMLRIYALFADSHRIDLSQFVCSCNKRDSVFHFKRDIKIMSEQVSRSGRDNASGIVVPTIPFITADTVPSPPAATTRSNLFFSRALTISPILSSFFVL